MLYKFTSDRQCIFHGGRNTYAESSEAAWLIISIGDMSDSTKNLEKKSKNNWCWEWSGVDSLQLYIWWTVHFSMVGGTHMLNHPMMGSRAATSQVHQNSCKKSPKQLVLRMIRSGCSTTWIHNVQLCNFVCVRADSHNKTIRDVVSCRARSGKWSKEDSMYHTTLNNATFGLEIHQG